MLTGDVTIRGAFVVYPGAEPCEIPVKAPVKVESFTGLSAGCDTPGGDM